MPGDPNNPFNDQLAQLNGITFGAGTANFVQSSQDVYFPYDGSTYYTTGVQVLDLNNGNDPRNFNSKNLGAMHVISYTYTALDHTNLALQAPPVFGVVTFDNAGVDGLGNPLRFSIRGFTENSIILSPYYNGYQTDQGYLTRQGFYVLGGDFSAGFPVDYGFDPSVYDVPVCFAEGSQILTPTGPVAVEKLVVGDTILTASGEERPIRWIGQMTSRPPLHPRPTEVNPVLVKAGAFGPGLPVRDLRLSPGHAVFVDGVLVPVGHLINGATIVQEQVEAVRYFHLELDSHDVLLAEQLPCESYLDDGNRASFANAGETAELHGRLDPKSWDDACAPMVAAGPQLVALQQHLRARAEEMGWEKREEADLAVVADGVEIAPLHRIGDRYWFAVPPAASLTLRSNQGVVAHVIPELADHRKLGVAVSELRVDGVAIDFDDNAFGPGFYPVETHGSTCWRWTDGEAVFALPLTTSAMIEVELAMVAPSWVQRAAFLRVAA